MGQASASCVEATDELFLHVAGYRFGGRLGRFGKAKQGCSQLALIDLLVKLVLIIFHRWTRACDHDLDPQCFKATWIWRPGPRWLQSSLPLFTDFMILLGNLFQLNYSTILYMSFLSVHVCIFFSTPWNDVEMLAGTSTRSKRPN